MGFLGHPGQSAVGKKHDCTNLNRLPGNILKKNLKAVQIPDWYCGDLDLDDVFLQLIGKEATDASIRWAGDASGKRFTGYPTTKM